ncbi:hypothetical protein STRIP9103_05435 [Streptomyces ipomoeae 91-03]|uniref:Uncharacterized protein n=1 Tax=Streptomyces ipomoeae 91-03 TaxID=698759 RepID=L1KQT7_9ACTN|nr:hypothetical protein STRIP9103_05435 [Streptomyces ipomoeae 91-03]
MNDRWSAVTSGRRRPVAGDQPRWATSSSDWQRPVISSDQLSTVDGTEPHGG